MLYFVQTATFFEQSSMDELARMAKFKVLDRQLNNFIIETSGNLEKMANEKKSIFVYSAFRLLSKSRISKADYLGSIYKAIKKAIKASKIGRDEVIRLECYDINNREGYSAKDLEVRFGKMLIKDGYNADILNPSRLVYAILLNGNCYVGQAKYADLEKKALNPLRRYSQMTHTSRAEMKIAEAFNEFNIKGSGIAVDLGAAPGGWSKFLAKNMFKVIAIDNANLDTASLEESRIKVKVTRRLNKADLAKNDIVQLKVRSDKALRMLKGTKIDMLANDMNMGCDLSAAEVLRYSQLLKKGGMLLMTIKCMTRNAPKYISETEKVLGKRFSIKGVRVLPTNRQEVTLYAVLIK